MDLVRIFEKVANDNCIQFHYGSKSHLNLIDSNSSLEPNKIHLLLFPLRRGNVISNSRVYNGNFFYVMPDDFSNQYYNETEQEECEGKYTDRIEPLITSLDSLEQKLKWCEGIDIVSFESVDAVDVLDANMSGLWVTFQFRVYE